MASVYGLLGLCGVAVGCLAGWSGLGGWLGVWGLMFVIGWVCGLPARLKGGA